jgi:hypothetical protein
VDLLPLAAVKQVVWQLRDGPDVSVPREALRWVCPERVILCDAPVDFVAKLGVAQQVPCIDRKRELLVEEVEDAFAPFANG